MHCSRIFVKYFLMVRKKKFTTLPHSNNRPLSGAHLCAKFTPNPHLSQRFISTPLNPVQPQMFHLCFNFANRKNCKTHIINNLNNRFESARYLRNMKSRRNANICVTAALFCRPTSGWSKFFLSHPTPASFNRPISAFRPAYRSRKDFIWALKPGIFP